MFYNELTFNLFLIDENVCIAIEYFSFCALIVMDVTSVTSSCRCCVYHPIVLISCWTYTSPPFVVINTG